MNNKFDGIVKPITIAETSSKLVNNSVLHKIVDKEGKSYSFFEKKMDGNETAAFREFSKLGNPVGKTVELGFKEEPFEFTDSKTGESKKATRRKVMFLKELENTVVLNDNGTYAPNQVIQLDDNPPF